MNMDKLYCIGYIDDELIEKADKYISKKKKCTFKKWTALAASFITIFLIFAALISFKNKNTITAYAYGTNEKITSTAAVIKTGTISDSGEMKGHQLIFYILGENIEKIRFSCKNHQLDFKDWKEKRNEYANAQNFEISYGNNKKEYKYLTISWIPNKTISELSNNENAKIKNLAKELKEDIIVMEVTFKNGNTATKAISISLSDNGKFLASFSDYKIKKTDKFVKRSNDKPLNSTYIDKNENTNKISSIKNERKSVYKLSKKQIKKAEIAAIRYYSKTIFTVNYIKFDKKASAKLHGKKYQFIVNVSKEGIVQNPDRMIILKKNRKGIWKVTNEGY